MTIQKALVVDDSKLARVSLRKKLQQRDLEVTMAESGAGAIDSLDKELVDVVFMDHLMPQMNGFEAMHAIKENDNTRHIPVIMCTGKEEPGYLDEAVAQGAAGILPKPPAEEALSQALQEAEKAMCAAKPSEPEAATIPEPEVAVVATAEPELKDHTQELTEHTQELVALKGTINDLQSMVSSFQSTIGTLQTRLADTETQRAQQPEGAQANPAAIAQQVKEELSQQQEGLSQQLTEQVSKQVSEQFATKLETEVKAQADVISHASDEALEAQTQALSAQMRELTALRGSLTELQEKTASIESSLGTIQTRMANAETQQAQTPVAPKVDTEALTTELKEDLTHQLETKVRSQTESFKFELAKVPTQISQHIEAYAQENKPLDEEQVAAIATAVAQELIAQQAAPAVTSLSPELEESLAIQAKDSAKVAIEDATSSIQTFAGNIAKQVVGPMVKQALEEADHSELETRVDENNQLVEGVAAEVDEIGPKAKLGVIVGGIGVVLGIAAIALVFVM